MTNFALRRDLAVTGTWYHHKDIHEVTWKSPDTKCVISLITHWLIEVTAQTFVI